MENQWYHAGTNSEHTFAVSETWSAVSGFVTLCEDLYGETSLAPPDTDKYHPQFAILSIHFPTLDYE